MDTPPERRAAPRPYTACAGTCVAQSDPLRKCELLCEQMVRCRRWVVSRLGYNCIGWCWSCGGGANARIDPGARLMMTSRVCFEFIAGGVPPHSTMVTISASPVRSIVSPSAASALAFFASS